MWIEHSRPTKADMDAKRQPTTIEVQQMIKEATSPLIEKIAELELKVYSLDELTKHARHNGF